MPDFHVYEPLDRPDVEVLHAGTWCPGEARMRTTHDNGQISYDVSWHRDGQQYIGTFPAHQVRLDTVDRTHGRG